MMSFQYEWSKKHRATILHLDGCLNDETWTPVHLQLKGFDPHFFVRFPDSYSDDDISIFFKQLEPSLRRILSDAQKNTSAGKLNDSLFGEIGKKSFFSNKRKRADDDENENDDEDEELQRIKNMIRDAQEANDFDAIMNDPQASEMLLQLTTPLIKSYAKCNILPLDGYQPKPDLMYDVTVAHPKLVVELRELILSYDYQIRLFDVSTDFVIRYLADNQFVPSSWYRLDKNSYKQIYKGDSEKNTLGNIIEFFVEDYKALKPLKTISSSYFQSTIDPHEAIDVTISNNNNTNNNKTTIPTLPENHVFEKYWTRFVKDYEGKIPNFRIVVYDIECKTDGSRFPTPERDPVISIQFQLYTLFGQKLQNGVQNLAFMLGSVSDPATLAKQLDTQTQIFCWKDEATLLEHFRLFILDTDPDIILHYNGNGFDFKYLFERAKYFKLTSFPYLGRAARKACYRHESENKGFKKSTVSVPGRINFDQLRIVQDYIPPFQETKLDAVANKLLGENKVELLPSLIGRLFETEEGRTRILVYGMKDVDLTRRVEGKLMSIIESIALSKTTCLPIQTCIDRAQGPKMEAKLYQYMNNPKLPFRYGLEWINRKNPAKFNKTTPTSVPQQQQTKTVQNPSSKDNHTPTKSIGDAKSSPKNNGAISKGGLMNTAHGMSVTNQKSSGGTETKSSAKKTKKKDDDFVEEPEDDSYEGASVLETKGGFYGFTDYEKVKKAFTENPNLKEFVLEDSSPVCTLDFASMYPSIMMLHNLCLTTYLTESMIEQEKLVEGKDFWRRPDYEFDYDKKEIHVKPNPTGPAFVLPHIRRGLIPYIEEDLGKDRKFVRDIQKADADEQILSLTTLLKSCWPSLTKLPNFDFAYKNRGTAVFTVEVTSKESLEAFLSKLQELETSSKVFEVLQVKIKGVMNSVYGLTGDPTSKFKKKAIAATVTHEGRRMIHVIMFTAKKDFCKEKGVPFDTDVIGGDTDSIFVYMDGLGLKFVRKDSVPENDPYVKKEPVDMSKVPGHPVLYLKEPFEWGVKMASEITKLFKPPCKLEFEKLILNMINIKAKNYIGNKVMLARTEPDFKRFDKGVGSKKRGLPAFPKEVANKTIDKVVVDSDIEGALHCARENIGKLVSGNVNIVDLSLVQKLSKNPKDYTGNPPAVVLARKRMEKDPTDIIEAGAIMHSVLIDWQRVNHSINKNVKRSDQVVEPLEAMLEDLPLDIPAYKKMVENLLFRMLHYVLIRREYGISNVSRAIEQMEKRNSKNFFSPISTPKPINNSNIGNLNNNNSVSGSKYPITLLNDKDKKTLSEKKKQMITKAVMDEIYKGYNPADFAAGSYTADSELKDKGNIHSYFQKTRCTACSTPINHKNKVDETISAEFQKYQKKLCVQCCGLLEKNQLHSTMTQRLAKIQQQNKEIWDICDKCCNGDKIRAENCTNMECKTRGNRHLSDKKLTAVKKQCVDIEDLFKNDSLKKKE